MQIFKHYILDRQYIHKDAHVLHPPRHVHVGIDMFYCNLNNTMSLSLMTYFHIRLEALTKVPIK